MRQQLFWMERWRDGALFPPSLLTDYAELYVPDGVKAVYRAAALVMEPLYFSKILPGALLLVLTGSMFSIGFTLAGRTLGFTAALTTLCLPFFAHNLSGGLSRAFAAPLLALYLAASLRRADKVTGLTLLAQALCIPYIFILCAGTTLLAKTWELTARIRGKRPDRPAFSPGLMGLAGLIAGAAVVLGQNAAFEAAGFGPLVSLADMAARPEFTASGRLDLYPLPNPLFDLIYTPFEGIGLFLDVGLAAGIISLIPLALLAWAGARRVDWASLTPWLPPIAFLAAASLILYFAARILAFRLFVPDRYVSYSFNIFYALFLAVCLAALLDRARLSRTILAALLVLAALVAVWRTRAAELYDYSGNAPLFAAVREKTPKNALLAGHPDLMDTVLTFGQRNALATTELAQPWSAGYWAQLAPRLDGFFKAYYARDAEEVAAFARRHGVDFLVVDAAHFTPQFIAKAPFFEPFGARIRELAQGRGDFILLAEGVFAEVWRGGGQRLLDVRQAKEPAGPK